MLAVRNLKIEEAPYSTDYWREMRACFPITEEQSKILWDKFSTNQCNWFKIEDYFQEELGDEHHHFYGYVTDILNWKVSVFEGYMYISGEPTYGDDRDMDGTINRPKRLSLQDTLDIASIIKRLMKEMEA